jgi:hypothetical protein
MTTVKHVKIVHPSFGEIINETFIDGVQFKIFLTMIHSCLELNKDLSTYNGKNFLLHVPKEILKQSLVIGTEKEMSVSEIVSAKSKLEG